MALVGHNQAINRGERGIVAWLEAAERHGWTYSIADETLDLAEIKERERWEKHAGRKRLLLPRTPAVTRGRETSMPRDGPVPRVQLERRRQTRAAISRVSAPSLRAVQRRVRFERRNQRVDGPPRRRREAVHYV